MNGTSMNGGGGGGWFQFPQPSPRNGLGQNGNGRSVPMETTRNEQHRVRFSPEEVDELGTLDILNGIAAALMTTVCAAGLATILTVLWVVVRPFSLPTYRRLAAQLGMVTFLDAVALFQPNTKIYLTGDSDIPSPVGTSLMVSNHLVDGDWWAMLMLGRCVGLKGNVKVFLRNEYLHVDMNDGEENANTRRPSGSNGITRSGSSSKMLTSSLRNENGSTGNTVGTTGHHTSAAPDLTLIAKLLHIFLEFPLINGEDYISEREQLFRLLRSFAANSTAPVHLLFFPEEWSLHNGANRISLLAKSNEFAKREGRPQLKHLLLPRTRGFHASLECLRESSPVVYDVTMAYNGYDGSLPISNKLSLFTLWDLLRRKFPKEVHIRVKRYSMEEVLHDSSWLDKKWAEKDRLLSHFARHQSFPMDSRGYCRYKTFQTRQLSIENSLVALIKLVLLPCSVPVLFLLSMPFMWSFFWIWLVHKIYRMIFPDPNAEPSGESGRRARGLGESGQLSGSTSNAGTPSFPATPFASPSITNWRDVISNQNNSTS
jgi:hypothetical protein